MDPTLPPVFSQAAEAFKCRVQADTKLKKRSRQYRMLCIAKVQSSWPGLEQLRISDVHEQDCLKWAAGLREEIAAQYFNNVIATLRLILDEGIHKHVSAGGKPFPNPAKCVSKARIPPKRLALPNSEQFRSLVKHIIASGSWGPKAADLVQFLAYSGVRLYTEAGHVNWEDIDWERKELVVCGSPESGTKNWEIRRIPLLGDMEALLLRMKAKKEALRLEPKGKLLEVDECPLTLRNACDAVGISRLRHHDVRHLFATRCIESGVDIPTVSRWLGHKDSGALAMRTYGHLRDEHSQFMAKKVKF